jgi:hypothetical protein
MVGQILPNNNEKWYNNFLPKFSQLNTAIVKKVPKKEWRQSQALKASGPRHPHKPQIQMVQTYKHEEKRREHPASQNQAQIQKNKGAAEWDYKTRTSIHRIIKRTKRIMHKDSSCEVNGRRKEQQIHSAAPQALRGVQRVLLHMTVGRPLLYEPGPIE